MKFPFVILPRRVYDDLMADRQQDRTDKRRMLRTIVKMKVSGGIIPRSPSMKVVPREPDPIEKAIDENKHARSNPRIRAALMKYADREREKNTPLAEIERVLRTWSDPNARGDDDDDGGGSDYIRIA